MPLKNRLEEVINRYERAHNIVKEYKEGRLSKDELGNAFTQLSEDRKNVDRHNREYLDQQRRLHLSHRALEEDVNVDVNDNDEDVEEEEQQDEQGYVNGSNQADDQEDRTEATTPPPTTTTTSLPTTTQDTKKKKKIEKKLWKQYGSFWDE